MTLDSSVSELRGVGEEVSRKLEILGVRTVADLLDYVPRRYDDYSQIDEINKLKPGMVTVQAKITQATGRYVRRGMHVTEAIASDDSGSVRLVWFNQPYRTNAIKAGKDYYITGEFGMRRTKLSILNPSAELVSDFPVNTARIVPVYRETKGLKSAQIRKLLREAIPLVRNLPETLPEWVIEQYNLMPRSAAFEMMHFPADAKLLAHAKRRLAYEEVFSLSLASLLNKYELLQKKAVAISFQEKLARDFTDSLSFNLTDQQRKAAWQIYQDLAKTTPMNRLLEGDVGSGKTVVATMAAIMAVEQGFQVAFMAPTELLARQHYQTIQTLLKPLKLTKKVGLLVGGLKKSAKQSMQKRIKAGDVQIIVGTHALVQEKVTMQNLGLVIVDEQHRFGVEQRKSLQAKAEFMPHVLAMTATPIPRSLALTLYGELDISLINTKPQDRKPIKTSICSPNSRAALYKTIDKELEAGRQMFVVCPLISESDSFPAQSAEQVYEKLSSRDFKHRRVGLLHGKMKAADKESVMDEFVRGKLDILVSTTVIEVGVDIPNATVMLIENADRFGLAQIHQLRGRVGRSSHQGFCYLMLSDSTQPSRRLRALESSTDGFALAELDLEIRGPGAIYGTLQHGALDLRVAKLTDVKLIAAARSGAQAFIDHQENLLHYHELHERIKKLRAVTNLN
ncbi:MAG: ATP-dependent DNA helicase RecG [Candidatus Saccharibacteria bacterium]|nr:ATP-dependent DNA helicase RecG [Candidatus Saccharibacteria bacterium]